MTAVCCAFSWDILARVGPAYDTRFSFLSFIMMMLMMTMTMMGHCMQQNCCGHPFIPLGQISGQGSRQRRAHRALWTSLFGAKKKMLGCSGHAGEMILVFLVFRFYRRSLSPVGW